MRLAAIEGGGTTWVVAIAENEPDNFVDRLEVATDPNPLITLAAIRTWLGERQPFDAIGIASFGPIDAKISSQTYGFITTTPKSGWGNTDVVTLLGLKDEFKNIPFLFDTDVNAPALAEYQLKMTTSNVSSAAYITIGTGVGVGLVVNGKTVHGLVHPEAGHIQVKLRQGDSFEGTCPYHGNCIEGMCSTGALAKRKCCDVNELPNLSDDDSVWDDCAYYIGQLCASLVLIASPERIIIGGGVLNRSSLYPKIRKCAKEILNGYIQNDHISDSVKLEQYIGPSYWGNDAGLVGASYLAKLATILQK